VSPGDLLRLVLSNLNRMRARVSLTAVGVMIGTTAVVLLISLGVGLQTAATSGMQSFGDLTTITVFSGAPFGIEEPGAPEPERRLDDTALREFEALDHVVVATPRLRLNAPLELKYGRATLNAGVQGIDAGDAAKLGWEADVGAFRVGTGQVVLGARVLESLDSASEGPRPRRAGPTPRPIEPAAIQGRMLTALITRFDDAGEEQTRSEQLRVAGVLTERGDETDYSVFLSRAEVEELNTWFSGQRPDRRAGYAEVLVKADDRAAVTDIEGTIQDLGFQTFSSQTILAAVNQLFVMIQAVLGGVGAVALLVAAVGIANTMTMAIYERTKEIGIMKAIGATNRDVMQIFLSEAGAIGLLGGLLGAGFGYVAGVVIDVLVRNLVLARQGPPPEEGYPHIVVTPVWLLVFAVGFATIIGLVSGVYPALRAASMKPLQALRNE
jgi:putative ABC transport system permease protein